MRCNVTVRRAGAEFVARCAEVPDYEGRGATSEAAVAKLRDQLVFWLEACPCDQTADDGLTLEVRES
jgi:predicted RNase H-like HicB family nuclease